MAIGDRGSGFARSGSIWKAVSPADSNPAQRFSILSNLSTRNSAGLVTRLKAGTPTTRKQKDSSTHHNVTAALNLSTSKEVKSGQTCYRGETYAARFAHRYSSSGRWTGVSGSNKKNGAGENHRRRGGA